MKINISPRAREVMERIDKWDCLKLKSFCMAKENINKGERDPTIWENIFASDTSEKDLIFKIYKELIWLHTWNTSNPIKKWAKDWKRHFSIEDIKRDHRHIKKCSTSLASREIQIKTTMTCHFIPFRMAIINKSTNKYWWGCGEKGALVHCWWECRLEQPLWKTA